MKSASEVIGYMNGEKNYLVVLESEKLKENTDELMDFLVNKREWTCVYLNLNKPYETVRKGLEKKRIGIT